VSVESTSSFFGDFEADDAIDTEPADPLQVAIRLRRLQRTDEREWHELADNERAEPLEVGELIVDWIREHGPHERERLADALDIDADVAEHLADWLIRQGAWR
jgi:hypothetical protein